MTPRELASIVYILVFGGGTVAMAIVTAVRSPWRWWVWPVAWIGILALVFLILGPGLKWLPDSAWDAAYLPGLAEDPPVYIFCEGYVDGLIKQPISVWTDLAFVASGMFIAMFVTFDAGATTGPPMRRPNAISMGYVLTVIYLGPGSMFYHASLKDWAGWCDWFSIINWAAFGLAFTVWRTLRPLVGSAQWPFWVAWGSLSLVTGVIGLDESTRETVRMIIIPLWVVSEVVVLVVQAFSGRGRSALGIRRNPWLFGLAILAFVAAFGCWMPSGGVWRTWCDPDSAMQGHGFWHLFAALGTAMVYLLWRNEREV